MHGYELVKVTSGATITRFAVWSHGKREDEAATTIRSGPVRPEQPSAAPETGRAIDRNHLPRRFRGWPGCRKAGGNPVTESRRFTRACAGESKPGTAFGLRRASALR